MFKIDMEKKRVLVTGGTGALGSEIVRRLIRSTPALEVTANFHCNVERATALQKETGCGLHQGDVGDETQVEKMFEKLSPLFAIVHAAGVSHDGLLLRQSRATWNDSLRVNADAAFLVARAALRELKNGGLEHGGRLIFLASRVGEQGNIGQTSYAAGKAAMLALMKCAAREGAEKGIAVNAICPGLVPSAMTEKLSTPRLEQAFKASVTGDSGSARETARMVQWLLHPASVTISGQIFHCDNRL